MAASLALPEHHGIEPSRRKPPAALDSPLAPRPGAPAPRRATARRRPPGQSRGSASGSAMPPTRGKLCSQTGSWTTTGVTSQRSARSHAQSRRQGARKSDTTNANEPTGNSARAGRAARASGAGRPRLRLACGRAGSAASPAPGQSGRPAAWSTSASSPRAANALAGQARRRRGRRALVEPRERRRVDRHRGSPVAHDHDARRLLGEVLADDELVVATRGRERAPTRPVDPRRSVARPVRPGPATSSPCPAAGCGARRSWTPRSAAAGRAGTVAVARPSSAPTRRRGVPARLAVAARARGSAPQTRSARAPPARLLASGRRPADDQPVPDHGQEEPLDVLRRREVPAVDERASARAALEREAAAHGCADLETVGAPRRADELDDPLLEQRVDVDVLDRGEAARELLERRRPAASRRAVAVQLLVDDPRARRRASGSRASAQEEAVELRLGQRERALLLDRVLGRDQEERLGQRRRARRPPSPGARPSPRAAPTAPSASRG